MVGEPDAPSLEAESYIRPARGKAGCVVIVAIYLPTKFLETNYLTNP
jgi:hypothetical protein